jgi:hypothetical protein
MMQLEKFENTDEVTLSNGATLTNVVFACEICTERGENPEPAHFRLEFEGQQIELCDAHAVEILNLDEDKKEDEFRKFVTITDPKV